MSQLADIAKASGTAAGLLERHVVGGKSEIRAESERTEGPRAGTVQFIVTLKVTVPLAPAARAPRFQATCLPSHTPLLLAEPGT